MTDDPERTLARGFVEHAKTVVTGLDATVRQAGTSRLILDIDDPDPLPRLDVKTGARGQLEVVKLLGSGGMAHVKLARQRALQRDVALKMLIPEERTSQLAEMLLQEGVITGSLEHPNIVPVHMLGLDTEGHPVIVMKRVEGVAWSRLDKEQGAHQESVWSDDPVLRHLEIFLQVCNAVSYGHARGYVHRDIKPGNVMIGAFGEVVLLDWGIACPIGSPSFDAPSEEGAIRMPTGTATYLAPEMVRPSGTVDERTDVYLLGATLHRVLTKKRRHDGGNLFEVLASALRSDPYPYDDAFPHELAAICNRATTRDPDGRFQTVEELRLSVVAYLRHKASLDLATEAEKMWVELERHADDESHDAQTRGAFAECRFAFRHALREWPENPRAKRGLARTLERMVLFELDRDHLHVAEALLTELDTPSERLLARIEEARQEAAREEARVEGLRELAYQVDDTVASTPRAWIIAGLAIMAVLILGVGLGFNPVPDAHERALWTMPPFLLVFGVGVGLKRREVLANLASRRLVTVCGITLLAITLHRVLGYASRPPFSFQLAGDLVLLAAGGAVLAVTASRLAFAAVAVWAAGACSLVFYSGNPLHIFGPATILGAALLAAAWWRRHDPV